MNDEVQTEEFSLGDVFKALLAQLKILILVLLVGCVMGGFYGYFTSYQTHYYGASVSFFVAPSKTSITDDTVTQSVQLAAKSDDDKKDDYSIDGQYTQSVMDTITILLNGDVFAKQIVDDMGLAPQAPQALAPDATEEQKTAYEAAFKRYKDAYKGQINAVKGAMECTYYKGSEPNENASRNYIYVTVSVLNNRDYAQKVLDSIETQLPIIVKENMPRQGEYTDTKCILATYYQEVGLTNGGYARSQTIRNAVLFGAAALVVACVIVIIVDMSDKRLRDYEVIPKKFNIPVLGVIPTIEDALPDGAVKSSKRKERK